MVCEMCLIMHPQYFDCDICDCSDCPVVDCNFVNKAVRKQIAKKVVYHDNCGNKSVSERCPMCFEVASGDYCEFCGQKLDWGGANE